MRRLVLPLVFVGLVGTLSAQAPQQTIIRPPRWHVAYASMTQEGDVMRFKELTFMFNGVTVRAQEATATKGMKELELSGRVRMTVE